MKSLFARVAGTLFCLSAVLGFAGHADAAALLISGGMPTSSIPQGASGNSVLGQAGIGFAGGQIWVDATLRNDGGDIALKLYDVGSESAWRDQIQMLNSTNGATVWDNDDHNGGTTGTFVNGSAPFQTVRSFTQAAGVTNIRFWRNSPLPTVKAVVNGQSPAGVAGSGVASIAFAYLDENYQIVGGQTNRILVLLEDGSGSDRDYDDYIGILEGPPVEPPDPPGEPVLSISGGTTTNTIPQGNSGNDVLGLAGIGFAGGQLYLDGTLDILGNGATLTLYDVGSESHWINEISLANTSGNVLKDWDDHFRDDSGGPNGSAPFQYAGSVTQNSGVAGFEFRRINPTPEYQTVVNGQSPMMMVPGYGFASIALGYLNDTNQIVSGPTDRVLVLLEDGGTDRDYDDYVGILSVPATPPPPYPVSPNFLDFGNVPKGTTSSAKIVTITNSGTTSMAIGTITVTGGNAAQFIKTKNCPASLAAGNSCTVSVVFKPASKGEKYGTLNIALGSSVKVVGLFGIGT